MFLQRDVLFDFMQDVIKKRLVILIKISEYSDSNLKCSDPRCLCVFLSTCKNKYNKMRLMKKFVRKLCKTVSKSCSFNLQLVRPLASHIICLVLQQNHQSGGFPLTFKSVLQHRISTRLQLLIYRQTNRQTQERIFEQQ